MQDLLVSCTESVIEVNSTEEEDTTIETIVNTIKSILVKVDAVTDNKPAQKAGLKPGDVIIQLGDHTVPSLEEYMKALGEFKKGDKTLVHFTRVNEKLSAPVEF